MATRTQSRTSNRSSSTRSSRENRSAFSWGEGAGPIIAAMVLVAKLKPSERASGTRRSRDRAGGELRPQGADAGHGGRSRRLG